jgi:hypothetical protein
MTKFIYVDGGEAVNISHVVKITDVSSPANGSPYILLELVNGNSVKAVDSQIEGIKRYVLANSLN